MKKGFHINQKIKDMKLRNKLAMVYALAGFLPVLVILTVTYFQMRQILRNKELETVNSYIYQAGSSVDNAIEIYNNLSNYIAYDQTISQVLSSEYSSIYEMYYKFETVLDPMLTSLMYFHEEVRTVTVFVDKDNMVKHGTTVAPIAEIQDEFWYESTLLDNQNHWFADTENNSLYSVRKMSTLDRNGMTGILYICVDYDDVFEPFNQTVINNYGIFVTDRYDNVVFEDSEFEEDNKKYALSFDEFKKVRNENNGKYRIISVDSETAGWKIWLYKPDKLMVSSMTPLVIIIIIAVTICFIAAVLCLRFIAKYVSGRIVELRQDMKKVEKGDLSVITSSDSHDEIGDLVNSFAKMLNTINNLINEVYKSKIKEKEYEMRALQAQINPHFLYNTLSLINWKALEAGAMDISKITLALSTFYRTSLNKGKNVMSISDEIDNMRSYISIQLMMHDNEFDFVEEIDPEILKYKTLNLVLQPLIENAIDHGIDLKSDGRGCITIIGRDAGDEIELIVKDNGVGMTKEQAERIITENSKGYGVRNVNERIKLYYGEQYALSVHSEIGVGTEVKIHFPKVF